MKLLGRNVKVPKRTPPRYKPSQKRSGDSFFTRAKPKPTEYETHTEVVMYQRKPLKTFKGPTSKEEARVLVSQMKMKDPNSRYVVKTKKIPKKGWF